VVIRRYHEEVIRRYHEVVIRSVNRRIKDISLPLPGIF
jgi:hypothetical protein